MEYRCDVLVAGGGIAGAAAALAGARLGADVILLEKQCVLGGLATSGLITIYLPLCDGRGTQVSYGIAEELFRLSIRHGAQAKYPEAWLRPAGKEERAEQRFEVQFNPVYCMLELERILLQEGVRIFYDTRAIAAAKEGNGLRSVSVANENGTEEITARAFVDATGDAGLFRAAGGETSPHGIGNSVAGWYYASGEKGLELTMLGFADLAEGSERDGVKPGSGVRIAGDTAEDVNRFLYLSHRATLQACEERKNRDPGFAEPALMAHMPQLRMIRRIAGEAVMTEKLDGVPQEDSVGMVSDWRKRGPRYEVPYGALYGKTENLFAAGRIVSCDDGMWDVMRVIPCAAVTGQACGTAAALTAEKGERAAAAAVQQALRAAGQRLKFGELD